MWCAMQVQKKSKISHILGVNRIHKWMDFGCNES